MMKPTFGNIASLAGSLLVASVVCAGAASAAEPPIRIVFDEAPLEVDAQPFIREGTTFVPFRALFERLGLQVTWDETTKTIGGEGGGTSLALRVGVAEATVDGEARSLSQPPVIVDGRTFVPLRFVSEAVGAAVDWKSAERLVTVSSGAPKAEEEGAIRAVYEAFVLAANEEDVAGIERLLHLDSPMRGTVRFALADAFERRDVETTIQSFAIAERRASSAVLNVTEDNVKLAGAYYMDNRVKMRVELRKDAAGAWKIYDAETLSQEWLRPFGSGGAADTVTSADETLAENTIASYMEALNREDLEAAIAAIDPASPMLADTKASLEWMFATYDLTHDLESTRVLERADNELYVLTVQTMRKKAGPQLADVRTESIHTLRLQRNGQWKLYSTVQGKVETLSIPH